MRSTEKPQPLARLTATCATVLMLTLAGCAAPSVPQTGSNAGTTDEKEADAEQSARNLVMAESAWLSVSENGEVYTTFLDPDGRYRDLNAGELAFAGRWEQDADGQLCFAPDRGKAQCWEHDVPGADGTMRASNPAGRSIALKRVAYTPPAPADPVDLREGDSGADADTKAGAGARSGGG